MRAASAVDGWITIGGEHRQRNALEGGWAFQSGHRTIVRLNGGEGSPVVDQNQRTGSRRCVLHEAVRGQFGTFNVVGQFVHNRVDPLFCEPHGKRRRSNRPGYAPGPPLAD